MNSNMISYLLKTDNAWHISRSSPLDTRSENDAVICHSSSYSNTKFDTSICFRSIT